MDFETLYRELERSAEIIPALIGGISQADAQIKPSAESWSILEVVCHLADEEREDFREHLDMIVNRPNDAWKHIDPQGWVTARDYNTRDLAASLNDFVTERRRSLEWLKELAGTNWDAPYVTPWGRHMTAGDMFASWVAHDNLHMRQIVELRRARIVQIAAPYNVAYAGEW